jgi:hypothetical protein
MKKAHDKIAELHAAVDEARRNLERAELKLEVALEFFSDIETGTPNPGTLPPGMLPVENGVTARNYRGLTASDAILRLLADEGPMFRKLIVNTLEHQIKTESSKPRTILRNVVSQLADRGKISVDENGVVALKSDNGE